MLSKKRILLWSSSAIAICIFATVFLLPSGINMCSENDGLSEMDFMGKEVELLLSEGKMEQARNFIADNKRQAKDSTEYYQFVVLEAKCYFVKMETDSFYACHQQLKQFVKSQRGSNSIKLKKLQAEMMLQRGVYEAKMVGRMDTALVYYKQALDIISQLPHMQSNRLMTLTNIADAYKHLGMFDQSVNYYLQAMELGDSIGMDEATQASIDIGIASAYTSMGNFEQSALWWDRAGKMKPKMGRNELFHYLNNRGNDLFLQERYEEALRYFLEEDSLTSHHSDMQWERMFGHANLSHIYIKLNQKEKALPMLDEIEQFFRKEGQQIPLYYIITQRIELAMLDGNIAEALRLQKESGMPDRMIPDQKMLRLRLLLNLYQQLNDWRHHSEVGIIYKQLQDSIMTDKVKKQFSEVLIRHEHERELTEKQQELERMNLSFCWSLFLLAVLIIVIVLLAIISYQKLKEQQLKEQNMQYRIASLRMETVRNRITPHFIANALTIEMLAQVEGKKPNLDSLVQLLHRGIEMTGMEQITLSEELEFIEFYCHVESQIIGPDFVLRKELADDVDPDKVMLPAMFMQIVVENALKHGLLPKPRQEGHERMILIRVTHKETGTQVDIIDNGIGMLRGKKTKKQIGLSVVEETIALLNEQNHEKMWFSIGDYVHANGDTGCCSTFYLPNQYKYVLN
jgi:tetratricopeptide (TPR) repeat protein